jgi:hypothetical protein
LRRATSDEQGKSRAINELEKTIELGNGTQKRNGHTLKILREHVLQGVFTFTEVA